MQYKIIKKVIAMLSVVGLTCCKPSAIKNVHKDGEKTFLILECPPYGATKVFVDDGMGLGDEWEPQQIQNVNWIQDNWDVLWPKILEKFYEMASNYAYGEKRLDPHMRNPKNKLAILPNTVEEWSISLEIELEHGGHAFCIDFEGLNVTHFQPVY
jgi:hypothetical protein